MKTASNINTPTGELDMTNVVYIKQNRVLTNSKELAAAFGKQHKNVLQKIEARMAEHSENFRQLNFQPTQVEFVMPTGGTRLDKVYELTKDGFMAIAMTFIGKKGSIFREKVIEEFNRRGEELQKRGLPITCTPELLEQAAARIRAAEEKAALAEAKNSILTGNAVSAVAEYGISAYKIAREFPEIAKAATKWAYEIKLAQKYKLTGRITMYLMAVHKIVSEIKQKEQGAHYGRAIYNRADIERVNALITAQESK